jgi:hypothetical protein
MKNLLLIAMLIPLTLVAQPYGGMTEQQMQQMMQGALQMQACIASIDESEMKQLEQKAKVMEQEIKTLCANGDRAGAQQQAITYSREFMASESMQKLKDCGELANSLMPQVMTRLEDGAEEGSGTNHVCDQ